MKQSVNRLARAYVLLAGAFLVCLAGTMVFAESITLNGGGASFPMPLYLKWFKDYHRANPNVVINYKAIGSGGGVNNFIAKRFDFAGSDIPMTAEEVAKVETGVIQVPLAAGAVVFIYHLEGIDNLRLSREAYTGIFLGTIKNWQDPLITKENKGVELPDKEIILVARGDSSGTSQILTQNLSAVSEKFAKTVGASKEPVWPATISQEGRLIKAVANGGVAQMVKVLPGSIGYAEFSYAHLSNLKMATLQNKAGRFVIPTMHSFAEAVTSALPSLETSVPQIPPDASGDGSYPILSLTWMICNQKYDDPSKVRTIKEVLDYCLKEGQRLNSKLGYLSLPEQLLAKARLKVDTIQLKK
jgi:phosphate transport system substrate-binding protein